MLDAGWPGSDAVALRTASAFLSQMLAANSERRGDVAIASWTSFDNTLTNAAIIIPLAQLSTVYARGPNVEQAPISPTFANADPANVALGSTRPGDPHESPTPTP